MPLYDYSCQKCSHEIRDEFQKMSDKPLKKCPACGKMSLERVILSAPYGVCRQDPKTLHHLAARNTEKMGRYEYESRCQQEMAARQGQSTLQEKGFDVVKPDYERPFWRDSDEIDKSLAAMTDKQKANYILKGEKP